MSLATAKGTARIAALPLTLTRRKGGQTPFQFSQYSASDTQQFLYAFYGRPQVNRVELRVTHNRLPTLDALLACDPDSELGISACPAAK